MYSVHLIRMIAQVSNSDACRDQASKMNVRTVLGCNTIGRGPWLPRHYMSLNYSIWMNNCADDKCVWGLRDRVRSALEFKFPENLQKAFKVELKSRIKILSS